MEEKRKPRLWLTWLVLGLVLLLVYPLSLGPVGWLAHHDYISEEDLIGKVLIAFYWPILWFTVNEVEPIHWWIKGYCDLWLKWMPA